MGDPAEAGPSRHYTAFRLAEKHFKNRSKPGHFTVSTRMSSGSSGRRLVET